ncbi:MAG TPA: peptidylprolyl isomerase, partial [Candidatus Tenderia electrophaga]|nr:peptidylprolyl isomerase [Candidatus Tenderia electrophaga]
AREKAEALLKQISEGASFEALARENSDDIGTANAGGDLGFLSQDSMIDPAYAEAAFALTEGAVSDVIKSAYGFHIIKLEAVNDSQVKSFAEVKNDLEQEYRRHQAEDKFFEQGEILANMTFENPDTLELAADELGLAIATTEMFSRDKGEGVAIDDRVRAAAFSEEVLLQGLNSQPLELAGDRVLVLRIKEHQESSILPFEDVKTEIVKILRQQAAEEMAEQEGKSILALLADNNTLESVAGKRGLTWNHPDAIKRTSTAVAADIRQKAFRLDRPEAGKPRYAGLRTNSGDYAVIALFAVLDADIEALEPAVVQSITDQRERYYGASELLGAMNDMRQTAEIKEFPENL